MRLISISNGTEKFTYPKNHSKYFFNVCSIIHFVAFAPIPIQTITFVGKKNLLLHSVNKLLNIIKKYFFDVNR